MLSRILSLLNPASVVVWTGFVALLTLSPLPPVAEPITRTQEQSQPGDASKTPYQVPDAKTKSADLPQSAPTEAAQNTETWEMKIDKKPDANYRLQKIQEWGNAVAQHKAGEADSAAVAIARWVPSDLEIVVGFVTKPVWKTISKATIRRLLHLTDQEVQKKDLSRLLKLGALLHTDIDLLELERGIYQQTGQEIDGQAFFADGRVIPQPQQFHWQLARRLIECLPSEDRMLRLWYIATTAHMQSRRLLGYAGHNLRSALEKLPSDERILFYAGALHEIWASPVNQNAQLPRGGRTSYGSKDSELRLARQFFQRALAVNPSLAEAHLRLGRVMGLMGDHKEAFKELQLATAAIQDRQLSYYLSLYMGYELEVLARPKEARVQYERAAGLFPTAQSPLLALSQLAGISGDSKAALLAVEQVFALPVKDFWNDDPLWRYDLAHVRDAAALIEEMHTAFGGLPR